MFRFVISKTWCWILWNRIRSVFHKKENACTFCLRPGGAAGNRKFFTNSPRKPKGRRSGAKDFTAPAWRSAPLPRHPPRRSRRRRRKNASSSSWLALASHCIALAWASRSAAARRLKRRRFCGSEAGLWPRTGCNEYSFGPKLHGMPAVAGEERQPELGQEQMVDLALGKRAGAGDDVVAAL